MNPLTSPLDVRAPRLAVAERQLVEDARVTRCGTSSRARRFSKSASVGIEAEDPLGEVRPGVGADDRVAVAEALLEPELRRVVLAGAVGRRWSARC